MLILVFTQDGKISSDTTPHSSNVFLYGIKQPKFHAYITFRNNFRLGYSKLPNNFNCSFNYYSSAFSLSQQMWLHKGNCIYYELTAYSTKQLAALPERNRFYSIDFSNHSCNQVPAAWFAINTMEKLLYYTLKTLPIE